MLLNAVLFFKNAVSLNFWVFSLRTAHSTYTMHPFITRLGTRLVKWQTIVPRLYNDTQKMTGMYVFHILLKPSFVINVFLTKCFILEVCGLVYILYKKTADSWFGGSTLDHNYLLHFFNVLAVNIQQSAAISYRLSHSYYGVSFRAKRYNRRVR